MKRVLGPLRYCLALHCTSDVKIPQQQRHQKMNSTGAPSGFLGRTLYRINPKGDSGQDSVDSSTHKSSGSLENGAGPPYYKRSSRDKKGCGRPARRPANGKSPGRRDPVAVARREAEEKLAAERREEEGTDVTWRLPTGVDYYTDRGARCGNIRRNIHISV